MDTEWTYTFHLHDIDDIDLISEPDGCVEIGAEVHAQGAHGQTEQAHREDEKSERVPGQHRENPGLQDLECQHGTRDEAEPGQKRPALSRGAARMRVDDGLLGRPLDPGRSKPGFYSRSNP